MQHNMLELIVMCLMIQSIDWDCALNVEIFVLQCPNNLFCIWRGGTNDSIVQTSKHIQDVNGVHSHDNLSTQKW